MAQYRKSTLRGEFYSPPQNYYGVWPIHNHKKFYSGWIKYGKNMRVFDNVAIEPCKSPARISLRDGTFGDDPDSTIVEITAHELEFLESEGLEFIKCDIYWQLKCDGNF